MFATTRGILFAATLLFASTNQLVRSAEVYTSLYLGLGNHAKDINDHGELAGEHLATAQTAIYFDGSRWIPSGNGDLYSWSTLSGINNNGIAVGQITFHPDIDPTQSIYGYATSSTRTDTNSTVFAFLTGVTGTAKARAINNLNIAVGDSLNAAGKRRAVRFETNGIVTDLGTLGGESSSAIDINDRGDIAGESLNPQGLTRGFFLGEDGIMRDIGTLGGDETFVISMNARGEIVGNSFTASGATRAFLYANGVMTDLGSLGGPNSAAYGINDHGVVVGMATKEYGSPTPFIKYPGRPMIDLAPQAAIPETDRLITATAINNFGLIIVRGALNASNYLLKPGVLTLSSQTNTLQLTFAAPENTLIRFDLSNTLTDWSPLRTNTFSTEPISLDQPITTSPTFIRAVLLQPLP
jgi:probable HAF family extracellular repeat protein